MPIEVPDYSLTGHGHRLIGNGVIFLHSGERLIEAVGTGGEIFFSADCGSEGSYRSYQEVGALLNLYVYGMAPLADPAWQRSFVKIELYADPYTSTLAISVAALHDLSLTLSFADGIRTELIDRLSGEIGDLPCLKLMAPSGTTMYVMADGCCDYTAETGVFHVTSGYSRVMLAVCDVRTDFSAFKRFFHSVYPTPVLDCIPQNILYRGAWVQKRVRSAKFPKLHDVPKGLAPLAERMRNVLENTQTREGGLLLGTEKPSVDAMCRAAQFFVADRNEAAAKAFCGFLIQLYRSYGRIPYRCCPDGSAPEFYEGLPERAGEEAVCFLAACAKVFGWVSSEDEAALASQVLAADAKQIRQGMMPFFSSEDIEEPHPRGYFDGSAEDTLRFLALAEDALFLMGDRIGFAERHRMAVLADFVASSFDRWFLSDGHLLWNQPQRAQTIRRPRTVFDRCKGCGTVTTLMAYPKKRGYGCASCLAAGATPPVITVTAATAPPYLIYLARARGFAASLSGSEAPSIITDRIRLRYADPTDPASAPVASRLVHYLSQQFAHLSLAELGETVATLLVYSETAFRSSPQQC